MSGYVYIENATDPAKVLLEGRRVEELYSHDWRFSERYAVHVP